QSRQEVRYSKIVTTTSKTLYTAVWSRFGRRMVNVEFDSDPWSPMDTGQPNPIADSVQTEEVEVPLEQYKIVGQIVTCAIMQVMLSFVP
ncbi:MAG: hypothetical protein NTZ05_15100, partial [Chloroflexi bacterium]|nr:hypothetical protein [Chloroflexota bacterium]